MKDSQGRIRLARRFESGTAALTLSTSASKDAPTTLASLDGLASMLQVSLSGTRLFYGDRVSPTALAEAQSDVCRRADIDVDAGEACDDQVVEAKSPTLRCEFVREALPFRRVRVVTGEVAVGYREAEFFDPEADAADEQPFVSGSATATFGLLTPDLFVYLQGQYENKLSDGDDVERCVPLDGLQVETCETLPLGVPERDGAFVLSFGVRLWGTSIALDPRLNIAVDDGTIGLELPVYALKDSSGRFTGGVRIGWRSDDPGDVSAAVFVAAPLGVFD